MEHSLTTLWPQRRTLWITCALAAALSAPLHLLRMRQLGVAHAVRGRGVLWLTVIEQRFFLPCIALVVAQVAVLASDRALGEWQCRLLGAAVEFLNFYGACGGTSIAICR